MSDPASPPPARKKPPVPPPRDADPPSASPASMTDNQKQKLALETLGLLNEQVQARIIHYKAELQTSPELDAITAQVVQQLKAMQAALAEQGQERKPTEDIEAEQIAAFLSLLRRVFNPNSQFTSRVLKPVGRRVAKLFFESELHEKTKGDKEKIIHHAEQGVYYVLSRYKNRLRAELEGFEYVNDEMRQATTELLAKLERDLQLGFLSRRSPELNRVLTIYTGVLADFLQNHLPPRIEQMAKVTIRAAKSAHRSSAVPHKVQAEAFADFRAEWERRFVQQMVFYCGDELIAHLSREDAELRDETVKFFTDPHVFSETCEVLCEELYDFLCMEGFLDLPLDWRVSLEETA